MKNNKNILTQKQNRVLELIRSFIAKHKEAPTISELRNLFNVDSLRTVVQHLEALERKGFIKRNHYKRRNIEIIEKSDILPGTVVLPVIASAGCDNLSVFAQREYDEYLTVDKSFVKEGDTMVAIKAVGDSMIDAGIKNGDYVLTKVTEDVKGGDRVVAIIGDKAVVKRINFGENAVMLSPESKNRNYNSIVMKHNFKVFGKVVNVISKFDKEEEEDVIIEKIKESYN